MIATKYISSVITGGKRLLKALCYGRGTDIRTTQECMPYGVDSCPVANLTAVYASTDNMGQDVTIGYINKNQQAATGEFRFYSTNSDGDLQASGWLHADGKIVYTGTSIELLGNANHATQYEALNTQLQNYITALNAAILSGVSSAGGTYVEPTTPLDLSTAKLTNIKTQ